ncbi:MAG: T9SS type A sorting domain-containing protein, partial [Bacteroidetes bacterium]|nr:T9SS type A sorting domain-containing protein [Bacteroidota bacterium]
LPTGAALSTQVLNIADAPLSIRNINFTTPVVVTGPYVLTITNLETATNKGLIVYTNYQNNQFPQDSLSGHGENLSGVEVVTSQGPVWVKMKTIFAIQTTPTIVDVDFLFLPMVEYSNLSLTSTVPTTTFCKNVEFTGFTVSPSSIIDSRFYNQYKCRNTFFNEPDSTYKWTIAGSPTPAYGANPSLKSATSGSIAVTLEANFGYRSMCKLASLSSHTVEIDECLSIETNTSENTVNIYPNPSRGIITVNATANSSVFVLNALGAVITEGIVANGNPAVTFDLSNQPNGIYFVKISSENGSVTKKVNLIK